VRDEFLVFGKPDIREEEIAEITDSLRTGWIGTGPKVRRFERLLEDYVGAPHVRCVSSCTAALFLGLKCLGVGPGDEVLIPAMTFVASANAVEHVGATPVFVDSEPGSGLVDLDAAEAVIGPRTRAIVPVHLAGRPVDMDRLGQFADRHGLLVIEDAAHAIGTRWRNRQIGAFGNLAAFSFYATKNITTSEGGALATEDPLIAGRIERLALHGLSHGAWQRFSDAGYKHYEAVEPGFKFNMTDLHAALGIHQLSRLDAGIEYRRLLWERYDQLLADLPFELPPPPTPEMHHARHLYQVLVSDESALDRDALLEQMTINKVGVGVHYRAVHLHPYYRDRYRIPPASLPVATDISARTLSLPLGTNVSYSDQDDVVEALQLVLG
jgi:dTDP-4-amino-4,6-dideoxygalactose transaminase